MSSVRLEPAGRGFRGEIEIPGDKSISHRAVMIGSIADGKTRVNGMLDCDDCAHTINAFRNMGVQITAGEDFVTIDGVGLKGLARPSGDLDAGESGTTMRLLSGILAGQDFDSVISGGSQLSKRPMRRIVEPLSAMGVRISSGKDDHPPIRITGGPVKPIVYRTPIPSAQIKSAIIFAGLYADGTTVIEEPFKSRDHTERMLEYFGADIRIAGNRVEVNGGPHLTGKTVDVPGDISSAGFFLVIGSIVGGSKIVVKDAGINPTRSGILDVMKRMGARISVKNKKNGFEPSADIISEYGRTRGITINAGEIPNIIDELPVIFTLAAASEGRTIVNGVGELKVKETDRILSMKHNLEAMGAVFKVEGDSVIIEGRGRLKGAPLNSFGDHRTCMASVVASFAADGPSEIDDTTCVSKSFPDFFKILSRIKE